jgi:hypothetical protein
MTTCIKCRDSGLLYTGRTYIPCTCSFGDEALFSIAGVDGLLPGSIVKKHFSRGCPEPIFLDPRIKVSSAFFSDGKKARYLEHDGLRTHYLTIDGRLVPADPNVFENIVTSPEEAPQSDQQSSPAPDGIPNYGSGQYYGDEDEDDDGFALDG